VPLERKREEEEGGGSGEEEEGTMMFPLTGPSKRQLQ